jgi:TolB-like protein
VRLALVILFASFAVRAVEPPTIAVTEFLADTQDRDRAKGLAGVVAARLASFRARVVGLDEIRAALDLEKQKQMLGCSEESCLQEISGALGVRYLVHGRLDRFGKSALLNAFVFDSRNARGVLRWSQRVDDDAQLVAEADKFALEAAAALKLEQPLAVPASARLPAGAIMAQASAAETLVPDFSLNLKLGNTIPSLHGASLSTFNLRFDLEGDYYFSPRWQAFLQAGVVIGSASDATGTQPSGSRSFNLFQPYAGAKYTFRALQPLRPYLSLGLGLSVLNKVFQKTSTAGLTTQGVFGLAWVPTRHVGLNVEASVNLAGVSSDGSGLYFGFNTNFGVLALF